MATNEQILHTPENAQLHGLAFGAFDTASKVLGLVNQLLGHDPAPQPDQPVDIHEMVGGATGMLTDAMRKLEAAVGSDRPLDNLAQTADDAVAKISAAASRKRG